MTSLLPEWSTLRTALAHDWLTGMRGGERVLELLCRAFPEATVLTLIHNPTAVSATINRHAVSTSWLQRLPRVSAYYRYLLPSFPLAVRTIPTPEIDLLISSSHCVAKSVKAPPGARHLCYCFTPMRYAWTFQDEYFGKASIKQAALRPVLDGLRRWDRRTIDRVDRFVAISHHVRERIETFYDREADVVYPPVDTARCTPGDRPGPADYDLIVSAMVPYKRVDLAIRAYSRLGYPLKVVGVGGELRKLKALAGRNIEFLGWRSDDEVLALYRGCRLLVFPGEEDFGIVPVEVQACGRPVVAYRKGGACETVVDGATGVFFDEQTENSLLEAVETAAAAPWDAEIIRAHTEKFGERRFLDEISACIGRVLERD